MSRGRRTSPTADTALSPRSRSLIEWGVTVHTHRCGQEYRVGPSGGAWESRGGAPRAGRHCAKGRGRHGGGPRVSHCGACNAQRRGRRPRTEQARRAGGRPRAVGRHARAGACGWHRPGRGGGCRGRSRRGAGAAGLRGDATGRGGRAATATTKTRNDGAGGDFQRAGRRGRCCGPRRPGRSQTAQTFDKLRLRPLPGCCSSPRGPRAGRRRGERPRLPGAWPGRGAGRGPRVRGAGARALPRAHAMKGTRMYSE
jgi:hypothetical protein